jgi:Protein of unknown function (DUF4238)
MTENSAIKSEPKQHHFVPQFYLRAFSENKKQINLYNFKRGQVISGAPIKKQCARAHFHAFAPGLEQALGGIEGDAATAIRAILDRKSAPNPGSEEWKAILAFIAFQRARTERSEQVINATGDFLVKTSLQYDPRFKDFDFDKIEIKNKYAIALAFELVELTLQYASDLGMHLLLNESETDFLTSDDPVAAHNQYCEGITYRGVLGWNCRGLQLFLPLSPRAVLLLYDKAVYKVYGSRHGECSAAIRDRDHVRLINDLQALNAHQNVYFMGPVNQDALTYLEETKQRRIKGRTTFVETEPVKLPTGQMSQMLHTYELMLPLPLTLPQITIRRRARRIALDARGGQYRHAPKERLYAHPNVGVPSHTRHAVRKITRK